MTRITNHVSRIKKNRHLLRVKCYVLRDQKGFTLIEAIVATALFAFVVTSVLGVYIATMRIDSKTKSQRAVTQNARYIMEFLAKEVRNGVINYPAYPSSTASSTSDLYVINQAKEAERFSLNGENLTLTKNAGTTNLNSASVRVTRLLFMVNPQRDPLTTAKTYNQQPNVTVVLELTSNFGSRTGEVSKINVQSTFSVRSYPSREPL